MTLGKRVAAELCALCETVRRNNSGVTRALASIQLYALYGIDPPKAASVPALRSKGNDGKVHDFKISDEAKDWLSQNTQYKANCDSGNEHKPSPVEV
jgi:hypothetical protein